MQRILLIFGVLVMLMAARVVMGQSTPVTEGTIQYEVKVNMHRRLPPDREGMRDMLPEFNIHQDQLFYTSTESLYKPMEEEEDDEFENEGMVMRFRRPMAEHYLNQPKAQKITLRDFMGKKFLIEDTLEVVPWKFGTEIKTILGYECRQATFVDTERNQTIVAWYTTTLRPFLGPEDFNTLPGTVLQVDINDGERVLTATKLVGRSLKKGELKVPSGGTKATQQEFRILMQEQMKRMGGNGNIIIRN